MSLPFVRLETGLRDHRKIRRLARILEIPRYAAMGLVVMLWDGTAANHETGDLSALDALDVADMCEWDGNAKRLLAALYEAEIVSNDVNTKMVVHGWAERYEKVFAERERKRLAGIKRRARATGADVAGNKGDVAGNAPDIPRTFPALSDKTREEKRREEKTTAATREAPVADGCCCDGDITFEVFRKIWNDTEGVAQIAMDAPTGRRAALFKECLWVEAWRDGWRRALDIIPTVPGLIGRNGTDFKANADWFLRPDTVPRLLAGEYDGWGKRKAAPSGFDAWEVGK